MTRIDASVGIMPDVYVFGQIRLEFALVRTVRTRELRFFSAFEFLMNSQVGFGFVDTAALAEPAPPPCKKRINKRKDISPNQF